MGRGEQELSSYRPTSLNSSSQIFRVPSNLRRVFLGIILQFSVQMTGVSVIQYYAPDIFAAIGFSYEKTFLFQTINSVIALIAQALCILTVDRVSANRGLAKFSGLTVDRLERAVWASTTSHLGEPRCLCHLCRCHASTI